ncbi:structure-specific endonuclease subunit SLX4 [Anopheles maculipalpis]|uniref:structure-specific endonuclease subunit SLX4 n=1 Tax=Anopheles maculipalpis TaxID=1496333 RepID=UPI002158CB1F|nr:structure-specific endonuclease subunit SLX4 [Anopheles maculipalpis]
MSKRLKFAKLRLAKPIDAGAPPMGVVPAEANVCTNSTVCGKTSKFFTGGVENASTEEQTFIMIHSDDSGEDNETVKEESSRRRTQKAPKASPTDGPKLPKIRKKACDGNALISNFLQSQPNQTEGARDDDFEESKSGKGSQSRPTKVQRVAKKTTTKAQKRPKHQSDIRKVFKKYKNDHEVLHELLKVHSASEQIDPEQLQIALAMSRSLADQEVNELPTTSGETLGTDCAIASCSGSSEERRIVSIRTTLEQFGFRCKNSYTDYDLNVIFGSASAKNVKKIKYKRATNLVPRSREELSTFIDSQAKKLFPLEMIERNEEESTSKQRESIQSHLNNLFWIAQTELPSEQLMEKFYVPELLEVNPAPVGCMLKDWSKIPGRESTPDRENDARSMEDNGARTQSPDLFNDSEAVNNAGDIDPIEEQLIGDTSAEKTDQTNVGENDDETAHSEEVVIINSSNESSCTKPNENAHFLKKKSPEGTENDVNKQCTKFNQVMENNSPPSCDTDRFAAEEEIAKEQIETVVHDDNTEEDEDKFVTAFEMSQCQQTDFHQSSENIFDDSDPNPMVSFEVYSSEEEKISAASQVLTRTTSSNGDIVTTDKVSRDVEEEEDSGKCNTLEKNDGDCLNIPVEEETGNTVEKDNISYGMMEPRFPAEKELSFHRLAIKARLSEAMEGMASAVETVDLIKDAPVIDKPESNLEEMEENLPTATQGSQLNDTQEDDVLYISDDEVNYSIRGESSRVPTLEAGSADEEISKEDPDMTIRYQVEEPIRQSIDNFNDLPLSPQCLSFAEVEPEIEVISSKDADDERIVVDSTFAYLDHLVKEFNLPPLKPKPRVENCLNKRENGKFISQPIGKTVTLSQENVPIDCNYSISHGSIGIEAIDEKQHERRNAESHWDASASRHNVPEISDELTKYLNNYDEPNFDDHAIAAEMIASQSPVIDNVVAGGKVLSRVKSSIQFDSPRNRTALKRTVSESKLHSFSTLNEKDVSKPLNCNNFGDKFNELKTATVNMAPTEYIISTSNVNQMPPAYEDMSTPEIERELFKYGLKSLQRSKAIRVLNYLFDAMHPYVMLVERQDKNLPIARKEHTFPEEEGSNQQKNQISTACTSIVLKMPRRCAFKLDVTVTEYFLPSKPRKKMAWCAVPLHISFFNLVSESESLQRQILRYEPINLDDIYAMLKEAGMRYETNDLIAFLDKHCITFRTSSSSGDRSAKGKTKDGNK